MQERILNVKLSKKFQNCFSPNLDQLGSILDARVRVDEQDLKNATEKYEFELIGKVFMFEGADMCVRVVGACVQVCEIDSAKGFVVG